MAAGSGVEVVVTGLNVFPVKSCRAVSANEIEIDRLGVAGDRRFMIVGGDRFTSQRRLPRLALVSARYVDPPPGSAEKRLQFSAPGMPQLVHQPVVTGERVAVTLWRDTVHVIDQGDAVARWLNEFVGMGAAHLRLVASAEDGGGYSRPLSELHVPAPLRERLSDRHAPLSDSAPVSVASTESLADLNRRLRERGGAEVGLKQFRMNIEVSGCPEAFAEDRWLLIEIGDMPFLIYRPSTRCKLTGVHQDTGELLKLPPLDILRTYRAPEGPSKVEFGQLLLPLKFGGKIKIGDRVNILEYKI
jgi:uncharacterized protein YcbX